MRLCSRIQSMKQFARVVRVGHAEGKRGKVAIVVHFVQSAAILISLRYKMIFAIPQLIANTGRQVAPHAAISLRALRVAAKLGNVRHLIEKIERHDIGIECVSAAAKNIDEQWPIGAEQFMRGIVFGQNPICRLTQMRVVSAQPRFVAAASRVFRSSQHPENIGPGLV
jgi:hypothetical protein